MKTRGRIGLSRLCDQRAERGVLANRVLHCFVDGANVGVDQRSIRRFDWMKGRDRSQSDGLREDRTDFDGSRRFQTHSSLKKIENPFSELTVQRSTGGNWGFDGNIEGLSLSTKLYLQGEFFEWMLPRDHHSWSSVCFVK